MPEPTVTTAARPRLLLLDGHSLAYRAFFALPVENFSTTTGQSTNAVYGFTSMLINVLRDEAPTHVAVAFDVSRQTFRSEEYVEYKANRSASPSEFKGQVSLVKEVLDALHIVTIEKDGFEADDVIATLSTQAVDAGFDVLICTGDRDALQLVNEHCTVLYPRKGVSDLARMTPEAVQEKYLVPPHRYPEIAALVGETSDNLPGVPGVGPKTAAKWITQYDGLDNVIVHADKITGKAGESFRAHLDGVLRNRRLNALVRDLHLEKGPADLAVQPWDRQEVHQLFDSLEFRVLRDRLFATLESEEEIDAGGFELVTTRLLPGTVSAWLDEHARTADWVGVQVEGTWRAGSGDVLAVALATEAGAAWVDAVEASPEDDAALAAWFADADRRKVLHDAKGPMLALAARGWPVRGLARDTALSAYLARPDQRSYDLADLTVRYLKRELKAGPGRRRGPAQLRHRGRLHRRGDRHAPGPGGPRPRRGPRRGARGPGRHGAAGRGRAAAGRDPRPSWSRPASRSTPSGSRSWSPTSPTEVQAAAQEAYAVIGQEINLGSPKQLQVVLFDELEHAEDQAHQDRLHHRRRRAPGPVREDRAPVPAAPAAPPRRRPGCARPSRACSRR